MNNSDYFALLQGALKAFPISWLDDLVDMVSGVRERRGTLYLAGNGGSHSVAQHWATDLHTCRVRTYCLGSNIPRLTAHANDVGYDDVFRSELAELVNFGTDALICMSCSGTSKNIQHVMKVAQDAKMPCRLISSQNFVPRFYYNEQWVYRVETQDYGVAEDVFAAIGHYLTGVLFDE